VDELSTLVARQLQDAGVTRIFGVPGGGPNLDLIGAAAGHGIAFVLTHGETAACIAAAAYGRLTGTVGVALVTRGPGMTAAAGGLAQATLDRSPLLLLTDVVPESAAGRVAHQRLDQVAAAAPLTKWSGTLGHACSGETVAAAVRLARAAPPGAVHLAIDPSAAGTTPPPPATPHESGPAEVADARRRIAAAHHPVVVVGVDATRDVTAVRAALRGLACPILVTYEAKGTVPESWPSYAGLFTGAAIERPLLERADLVLGVGLDPVEPMPGPWPAGGPVLLLHEHAIEAAYFGRPTLLVGRYTALLPALTAAATSRWAPDAGRREHAANLARLAAYPPSATGAPTPHDVVAETRAALGDTLLTVDAGAHMLVTMPVWETDGPDPVLISNGLATMGFALPAAIGAALARPGRRVACLVGDGGLGIALAELETLARLALDVTVVVFNDAALTLISLKQGDAQGGRGAVEYGTTDFAAVATGMGVPGLVARDVAALRRALATPGAGPRLVDVRVDPAGYRHILRTIRG
jgi:acetolactate synthase I/II/III large subunit